MTTSDEPICTIREAATILSFGECKIPVTTIQTWQRQGAFNPVAPAKPRDPRGSRLSLSDLVVLLLLHCLFSVGIRFEELREGQLKQFLQYPSPSDKLDSSSQLFFKGSGTSIQFTGTEKFTAKERLALSREIELRRRPIQTYFEISEYRCFVHAFSIPEAPVRFVLFGQFAQLEEEADVIFPLPIGIMTFAPTVHTFIDVRPMHSSVVNSLEGHRMTAPLDAEQKALLKRSQRVLKKAERGALSKDELSKEVQSIREESSAIDAQLRTREKALRDKLREAAAQLEEVLKQSGPPKTAREAKFRKPLEEIISIARGKDDKE
jgi:hypothetical protein